MAQPLVLCYHGVSDDWEQALAVREDAFERQLEAILRRRYRPVGASEAVSGDGRLLHVTFDDAYRNIAGALEVLERLGTPATIFASSAFADQGGRPLDVPELADEAARNPQHLATMDWDELRAVAERGFEIGSHTVSHPHLPRLSDAELDRELADSRGRCEEELDRPCRFLAYPYGEHDVRVRAAARRAGYEAAFSLHTGHRSDPYAVPRVDFYRRDSLPRAMVKTTPVRRPAYALAARLRRRSGAAPSFHGDGWLAAALPAGARRVRVADPRLAATLAEAGAELVERDADVEIAPAGALQGDAHHAVVPLDAPPHDSPSAAVRAGRRVVNSATVRLRALRARRALPGRGYPRAHTVLWDNGQAWRGPGAPDVGARAAVEHLPQHAVVIGRRGPAAPTLLDAVLADAGSAAGMDLSGPVSVRNGGVLLAVGAEGILRAAVGPGGRQIRAQLDTLRALHAATRDPRVAARVAQPVAGGRSGLADWSVERRLEGMAATRLDDRLLADAAEFLVALHAVSADAELAAAGPASAAAAIGAAVPQFAAELAAVGGRLEEALARVPRGFGHGDFFLGNLLVHEGRLSGVIDWDAGGPGRLPLIDLIHMRHMAAHDVPDDDWGESVVERLLPWARAGGDALAREHCARVGVDPDPATLEALALAYWLDRTAYQLRTHAHRLTQERWLDRTIGLVLRRSFGQAGRIEAREEERASTDRSN
jgi:peptidoglycan/xylan/chitin deacetylase (PgdA/CDA1 family)